MGLVRDAESLVRLVARRLVILMDNLEDVMAMQSYRIGGTQRVGKHLLMQMRISLFDQHGSTVSFEHVLMRHSHLVQSRWPGNRRSPRHPRKTGGSRLGMRNPAHPGTA